MKSRELVRIGVKIFALYLLITSLMYFQSVIYVLFSFFENTQEKTYMIINSLAPFAVFFIASIILFSLNKLISKLIVRNDIDLNINATLGDLQSTIFAIIGLYLMITSFSDFLNYFLRYHYENPEFPISAIIKPILLTASGLISQFILGTFLFVQSKGIVTFWKKINNKS